MLFQRLPLVLTIPYGATATVRMHGLQAADDGVGFGSEATVATIGSGTTNSYISGGVVYTDYTATVTARGVGTTAISGLIDNQPVAAPYPTLTVTADATGIKVASAADTSAYGQPVTFTAEVINTSGTGLIPTGSVQFVIDGAYFGSAAPVSNGTASITTATLTAGHHSIAALYTSDTANFDDSSSAPVTQTVSRATLIVTADDQSMVYGSAIPALTVSYSGFVNGDAAGVLSGSPALTTAATAGSDVGSYTITVAHGTLWAANYTFTFVNGKLSITPAPLTVTVADATKVYGQDIAASLIGAITGIQNGDPITAAYSSAGAGVGATPATYAIDAVLSDGGTGKLALNYMVTIKPGTLTVNQDSTTTPVASSRNPSPYGRAITLTATVTANVPGSGTPTGTVTFYDGAAVLGAGTLSGGLATLTTTATGLTAGTHTITVRYNGDSDFLDSTSAPFIQAVLSARDQIVLLIGQVDHLVNDGVLNGGNGNALTVKLKAALASLDAGKTSTAVNQLNAFINQVVGLLNSSKLTADLAQPLLDAANQAIDSALA
jgi:hypothetical protein